MSSQYNLNTISNHNLKWWCDMKVCSLYDTNPTSTYYWQPDNLWHFQAAMQVLYSLNLHPCQKKSLMQKWIRYTNEKHKERRMRK